MFQISKQEAMNVVTQALLEIQDPWVNRFLQNVLLLEEGRNLAARDYARLRESSHKLGTCPCAAAGCSWTGKDAACVYDVTVRGCDSLFRALVLDCNYMASSAIYVFRCVLVLVKGGGE